VVALSGPTVKSWVLLLVGPVGIERESKVGVSVAAEDGWSVKRPVRRQTNAVQKGRGGKVVLGVVVVFIVIWLCIGFGRSQMALYTLKCSRA
jgi:hypothetical protein